MEADILYYGEETSVAKPEPLQNNFVVLPRNFLAIFNNVVFDAKQVCIVLAILFSLDFYNIEWKRKRLLNQGLFEVCLKYFCLSWRPATTSSDSATRVPS